MWLSVFDPHCIAQVPWVELLFSPVASRFYTHLAQSPILLTLNPKPLSKITEVGNGNGVYGFGVGFGNTPKALVQAVYFWVFFRV